MVENRNINLHLAQGVTPSEFREDFDADKTRMINEKNYDKTLSRFHKIPERNGRTDG